MGSHPIGPAVVCGAVGIPLVVPGAWAGGRVPPGDSTAHARGIS